MNRPVWEVQGGFLEEVTLDGGYAERAGRRGDGGSKMGENVQGQKDMRGHDGWDAAI